MDPRERTGSAQLAISAALNGRQAQIWTCLPGIVQNFNPAKMTCQVQPTIQGQFLNQAGTYQNVTMPLCVDCPVVFPGGGGFIATFPIAAGDEVLIVFASRCIDGWWQSGQVSPQAQLRMHDLSDGFVIPKIFSVPKVPTAVSTTSAQLRTLDGTSMIELAAGGVVNVLAPGGMNVTGNLNATGEITANSIPLSTHIHAVTIAPGDTGAPLP